MSDFQIGNLVYLVVLGCAVVFWFITNHRQSLGRSLQQALAWGLIFLGVIAAVAMWDDIRSAARPGIATVGQGDRIEVSRASDGHFHLLAKVNGINMSFIIDTGASVVVLTQEDARRAGLNPDTLPYFDRAMTANGEVAIAPVRLDSLSVGPIEKRNVRAAVNGGDLHQSLLGMSYLSQFSEITISGNRMVIVP